MPMFSEQGQDNRSVWALHFLLTHADMLIVEASIWFGLGCKALQS